jgi:hypothetical protein
MRCSPLPFPLTRHRPGRRVAGALGLCAALLLGSNSLASPEPATPGTDPLLHLLRERGLLPSQAPGGGNELVRQVRDVASDLVMAAMNFIGVPYRAGGQDGSIGFDCSGFTRHVFEISLGLVLPRRADDQASARGLTAITREELRPGDLVFFNTLRRTFSHVGIYVGDGKFIHAPRAGSDVRIEDMRQAYWQKRFTGARRADLAPSGSPTHRPTSGASQDGR